MKLIDFVTGGFYINLDYRVDRKIFMEQQLNKLNLSSFVNRVDAIKILDQTLYTRESPDLMSQLSQACTDSHKKAVSLAKEKHYSSVLILEDDALFLENSLENIENSIDELNNFKDWDIVYLGAHLCDDELELISEHLIKASCVSCAHAYILNSKNFDKVINSDTKYMDIFLNEFSNKYVIYPMSVIQSENFLSDLGGHRSYGLDFWKDKYNKPIIKKYDV